MHVFFKSVSLSKIYIALAIKHFIEYKHSLYIVVFNQLLTTVIWLVFWRVIFDQIQSIGTWGFEEMLLLTGFVTFSSAFWFLFVGIWNLSSLILKGELNMFLIRPVDTLWHIFGKALNLLGFPRILFAFGIFIAAFTYYALPFDVLLFSIALLIAFISFIIGMLPFLMIGLLTFWIGDTGFARDLFIELFVFENYPLTEFPRIFLGFFTFIFPLAFGGVIPTLIIINFTVLQSIFVLLLSLLILVVQLFIIKVLWTKGLQRYDSYGG